MPIAGMKDETLADYLCKSLTDYEFEMLVRERIKSQFEYQLLVNKNLDESHSYCSFKFSVYDKSTWEVSLGGSYRDRVSMTGEVLTITLNDCNDVWRRQNQNKLSLLLPE